MSKTHELLPSHPPLFHCPPFPSGPTKYTLHYPSHTQNIFSAQPLHTPTLHPPIFLIYRLSNHGQHSFSVSFFPWPPLCQSIHPSPPSPRPILSPPPTHIVTPMALLPQGSPLNATEEGPAWEAILKPVMTHGAGGVTAISRL